MEIDEALELLKEMRQTMVENRYIDAVDAVINYVGNTLVTSTSGYVDCQGCEYYDEWDNRCRYMNCDMLSDCDEPLPCEGRVVV